ncbi:MAG: ABC transporter ATP-binding protein [Planctomycetota bacterium]
MALLELVDVRRSYRFGDSEVRALDGVSFVIEEGSFVGVIGRSGSGKSTLLNILGGLDRPSTGHVKVEGAVLSTSSSDKLAAYRREIVGFIFQSFNLIPHLTSVENVALPLALRGVAKAERTERAQKLLEKVGLAKRMGHRPTELSGGERQRVAIARALVNEPRILLCDEPTGNLDSKTAEEIMGMLTALHKEGRTVILVTHDREQANTYAERLLILGDGKLEEDLRLDGSAQPATPAEPAEPAE